MTDASYVDESPAQVVEHAALHADRLLARYVKERRQALGLSQTRLAEAMPFRWQQTTVYKIENGERPVRFAEAVALATVLGTTLERLAGLVLGDRLQDSMLQQQLEACQREVVRLRPFEREALRLRKVLINVRALVERGMAP